MRVSGSDSYALLFVFSLNAPAILRLFCRLLGMKKLGGSVLKTQVAAAVVVGIWIYNAAFNSPWFVWTNVGHAWGRVRCYPQPDPVYVLAARIINFYVPVAITWTCNVGIIYRLKGAMSKASRLIPDNSTIW